MNIRELLNDEEMAQVKERAAQIIAADYYTDTVEWRGDGDSVYRTRQLRNDIETAIKDQAREMMRAEVERISRDVIGPRIAEMAEKMTDRFVKQTTEIVNKINWHWSIK